MALDRFIYWNDERPTNAQIKQMLVDFVGGGGVVADMPGSDF